MLSARAPSGESADFPNGYSKTNKSVRLIIYHPTTYNPKNNNNNMAQFLQSIANMRKSSCSK